jgi:hypothetical protein
LTHILRLNLYTYLNALLFEVRLLKSKINSITSRDSNKYHYKMANYSLKVNGKTQEVDVDASTPMLWVLGGYLDLAGTKFGLYVPPFDL